MPHIRQMQEFRERLNEQAKAAYAEMKKPIGLPEIAMIVGVLIQTIEDKVFGADKEHFAELEELSRTIRSTRDEIAAIQPQDIGTDHIPRATDELDAVVCATEEATNKIMDVCDEISKLAAECSSPLKDSLIGCTTKIFEACNFQDVTGQRITKVVAALKHIDGTVDALLRALGHKIHDIDGARKAPPVPVNKDTLLNGPQLPKDAISQADIDKLLSDF